VKILTTAEMREVDRLSTERYAIPSLTLMENAGSGVAKLIAARCGDLLKRRIVFLCGKGNNGGDGLVAARHLRQIGADPIVVLCTSRDEVRGDAAINLQRYQITGAQILEARNSSEWANQREYASRAHVIVDALLGTGLRGPVEGLTAEVIRDVNAHRPDTEVVAVDIPSGVGADTGEVLGTAITADATATFTAPKIGTLLAPGSDHVGQLVVIDIGSPAELLEHTSRSIVRWLEPSEFAELPLRRPYNSSINKGRYGHALIVAGSRGKTGAATMVGWAALRSGAGLVTVATPSTEVATVSTPVPELMTEALEATNLGTIALRALESGQITEAQKGKSVVAVGPGLAMHDETQQVIRAMVANSTLNVILDADGLNAFAGRRDGLKRHAASSMAITPHPGEMARLLGCEIAEVQRNRIGIAVQAAANWNLHVVLKGHQTVIAAPDGRAWINSTGNPGMATAGTGDVLTGMLAGLAAQFGKTTWEGATCAGVYLHGLAGDLAAKEVGQIPMTATDVIRHIPQAFRQLQSGIDRVDL
jgi:ADP-dependent NAD(P)H-hydrate dehydratase / NAD(P)H-hydrate epimerase